jgi:hypothetical protein
MFQFPGLPPLRVSGLQPDGFPHSDICGLTLVCNSPQLFAAYHVLHRLREPRHPPYALVLLPILVYLFYIYSIFTLVFVIPILVLQLFPLPIP